MHWPSVPQMLSEPMNMQKFASGQAQFVSTFFE